MMATYDQSIEAALSRAAEIKELEGRYGRRFLEKSLHAAGIRWRELTAPNASERFRSPRPDGKAQQ